MFLFKFILAIISAFAKGSLVFDSFWNFSFLGNYLFVTLCQFEWIIKCIWRFNSSALWIFLLIFRSFIRFRKYTFQVFFRSLFWCTIHFVRSLAVFPITNRSILGAHLIILLFVCVWVSSVTCILFITCWSFTSFALCIMFIIWTFNSFAITTFFIWNYIRTFVQYFRLF